MVGNRGEEVEGRVGREGVGRDGKEKGWMFSGRECRERGGTARLGYLSRGPEFHSYTTGTEPACLERSLRNGNIRQRKNHKVLHGDAPRDVGPLTRVDDLPGRRTPRSTNANRVVVAYPPSNCQQSAA